MAELLIRVHNKLGDTPEQTRQFTKRGDVIVVRPDGWAWGIEERAAPFWRIVKLPNVTVEQAAAWLAEDAAPGPPDRPQATRIINRRSFSLNLAQLGIDDGPTRTDEYVTVTLPFQAIQQGAARKPV